MADLWCGPCEQSHSFTGGEIERLVYALQIEASVRGTHDPQDVDYDEPVPCLETAHTWSLNEYADRVDGLVDERHEFGRRHG